MSILSTLRSQEFTDLATGCLLGTMTFLGSGAMAVAITNNLNINSSVKTFIHISSAAAGESLLMSVLDNSPVTNWMKIGTVAAGVLLGAAASAEESCDRDNLKAAGLLSSAMIGTATAYILSQFNYSHTALLIGGISASYLPLRLARGLSR